MKKHSDLTKSKKADPFVPLFARAGKLKRVIGVVISALGFISAADAALDACQKTTRDLLQACSSNAEADYSVALGKCDNLLDPRAREDCRKEAAAELRDARESCGEQFDARQATCEKLGGAPYDPMIDPKKFVAATHIFRCLQVEP